MKPPKRDEMYQKINPPVTYEELRDRELSDEWCSTIEVLAYLSRCAEGD